ncbi:hypothetical protein LGV61_03695 [Desulfurispirillum indicum]|uniref:Uncharacterized protein n=1 Tax=Desulfurispirillum indicum (strain ATCC BAA-1389 / DSM 22839 / S5) TaxID=653733 RepID=E6W1U2_DESIS|nr:hypothetical protein [Desulfurispirillum indicum]ADU65474.1 hypothetical protein Selin_0730 [Desulfurispirillum indicum S5]UCZ57394.1 hypothetical protein LGV61_03695 [Desulfurispirillum indicum]
MNVEGLGGGGLRKSVVRLPDDDRATAKKTDDSAAGSRQGAAIKDEIAVENRLAGMSTIRDVDIAKSLLENTIKDIVSNGRQALDAYRDASGSSLSKLL